MNTSDMDQVTTRGPESAPFLDGQAEPEDEAPRTRDSEPEPEPEPEPEHVHQPEVIEVNRTEALVLQPRPHWFSPEQGEPIGMATGEQLDLFRELRTRLLAIAVGRGLNSFTILVAPLAGRSGASFVARNLAASLTLQEDRIAVLIDCNLRNPTQHVALGATTRDTGLFQFLEQPDLSLDQLVIPTVIPRLHLIPAGKPSVAAREYFSSFGMNMLLDGLRQEMCCTVLDGPPVQGAPDARILSELADMVVLVVGYGRSSAEEIAEAAAVFDRNKFAGVVFNDPG